MKANSAKKLAQSILSANIDGVAAQIVNELEKELDLAQIAYKAISLLIGKSDAKGPNSIGVDNKTFESYIKKARAKEDEKRSNRSNSRNRRSFNRGNERGKSEKSGFSDKSRSSKKGKK
jgi:hypothetical protein